MSDVCSNRSRASGLTHEHREIVMPPAKKAARAAKKPAAPVKNSAQATVTLKHLAAALSDSHDLPKKLSMIQHLDHLGRHLPGDWQCDKDDELPKPRKVFVRMPDTLSDDSRPSPAKPPPPLRRLSSFEGPPP